MDVTKDELKLISTIWFGSLAAIVALTGTILALAGLVVRYHQPKRTWYSVRGVAVALRQHLRRRLREGPKIVTKEVPVDKVVFKEVPVEVPVDKVVFKEVPKEVVRKEIVYVPLYTNDSELLQIWDGISPLKPKQGDGGANKPSEASRDDDLPS